MLLPLLKESNVEAEREVARKKREATCTTWSAQPLETIFT